VGVGLVIGVREASHVANILETVDDARFELATAAATSDVIAGLSTITVSLRANADIRSFIDDRNLPGSSSFAAEPPAVISIRGFTGSLTPSGLLPLSGPSARLFTNASIAWNQTTGRLALQMVAGSRIPAHEPAAFAFELRNGPEFVPAANVSIRITGALAIPAGGGWQPLAGAPLNASLEPGFPDLFLNYTSTVQVCVCERERE